MNMSMMKIYSFMLYFLSLIMTLSCKSYFCLWVFMEVTMLMFIMMTNKINLNMNNSLVKYFIIQSMSSMLLLFIFIIINNFSPISQMMKPTAILNMTLWMKMGMFPFNMWFFQISENMNWKTWFLLNTFQKLVPLWLMSMHFSESFMINTLIMINSLYSSIEMFNQTSTRWLINCSSMNHFSWMMISMPNNSSVWLNYFIIYSCVSMMLFKFHKKYNWKSMINSFNNYNNNASLEYCFIMMNFMGLPPLMGFIPKLIILYHTKTMFLLMILMINNIIMIYMYMYMCLPVISLSTMNKNMMLKNNKTINFYLTFWVLSLIITFMY